MNDFKVILTVGIIVNGIIKKIIHNFSVLETVSNDKIFYIILSATKFSILTKEEEVCLLNYLIDGKIIKEKFLCNLLQNRVKNIDKHSEHSNIFSGDKVSCAVVVSGQFREPLKDINSIISKINSIKNLYVKEIFISSWKNVGGYSLSADKIVRHLSPEVLKEVKEGVLDIQKIISMVQLKNFELSDNDICSLNVKCNTLLNDESIYPYKNMSNPEKMYFNNALWIETKGREYFNRNFDIIIKVRPDIEIKEIEINELFLNTVYAEDGWIFRRWGFGMGDQIIIGHTNIMCELLSCHNREDICNITQLLHSSEKYRGHVNLGLLAWSLGLDIKKISDLNYALKKPPAITKKFLDSVIE